MKEFKHIKVIWNHEFADEPIILLHEIDNNRWEIRKIEIYRDGKKLFAKRDSDYNTTRLSEVPLPALEEINLEKEFDGCEISSEEFEVFWSNALP